MPTDSALLVAGQGPAPLDYDVPDAQEIIVLSARAVVDGSGAGSAFLPVVEYISDGGVTLTQAITDATVAAGGSAQVSWFPRVGSAAAAVAAGTPVATVQLAAVANPLAAGNYAPNILNLDTNTAGASVFSVSAATPSFLDVAEAGIYCVYAQFNTGAPITLPVGGFVTVQVVTTGLFGTITTNVVELANTVATRRIQQMSGIAFTQFASANTLRYILRVNQATAGIGDLGYTVWRIDPSITS